MAALATAALRRQVVTNGCHGPETPNFRFRIGVPPIWALVRTKGTPKIWGGADATLTLDAHWEKVIHAWIEFFNHGFGALCYDQAKVSSIKVGQPMRPLFRDRQIRQMRCDGFFLGGEGVKFHFPA